MSHQFTPKYLFALIVPLIFESLLNMMIGMADTIMVANCGEAAVSAVSLVDHADPRVAPLPGRQPPAQGPQKQSGRPGEGQVGEDLIDKEVPYPVGENVEGTQVQIEMKEEISF